MVKIVKRQFGWVKQEEDPRDFTPETPLVAKAFMKMRAEKLPENIDLRAQCSPVVDQGQLGSCTANAEAGDIEFIELKQSKEYKQASRLFIYYTTRHLIENTSGDIGASIRDTIKAVVKYGVCLESSWPYNPNSYDMKPPQKCFDEALNFQTLTYVSLNNLNDIQTMLANGLPVQLGFYVFESFDKIGSDGIMPMPNLVSESMEGGHAVMAVGYKTINGKLYLIIRNSWGTGWGDKGHFYMPVEYLDKTYRGRKCVDDIWVILTQEYVTDTPTPSPTPGPTPTPNVAQAINFANKGLKSGFVSTKNTYFKKIISILNE